MKGSFILLGFFLTSLSFVAQSEAITYRVTNNDDLTIITIYNSTGGGLVLKPHSSVITDKLPEALPYLVAEEIDKDGNVIRNIPASDFEAERKLVDTKASEVQSIEQNTNTSPTIDKSNSSGNNFQKPQPIENNVMSEKNESNGFTGFLIIAITVFLIWRYLHSRNRNRCGSCGAINDSDAVICESCGKKLHEVVK